MAIIESQISNIAQHYTKVMLFAVSFEALLKEPDWKLVNDISYNKKMLSSPGFVPPIGYMEQIQGDAEFDVVMRRNQKTIDPATGTTVYEFWFAPETIGTHHFSF